MFSLKLNVIVMKDNGSTLFVRSHWASLLNLFSLVALLFVAVALIYNWWTLYVRCVQPTKAREAIQSRPLLLSAVGRDSAFRPNDTALNECSRAIDFGPGVIDRSKPVSQWIEKCCGAVECPRLLATDLG
jgi:hypothetical protein